MGKPSRLRKFFSPSPTASFWVWIAPYAVLAFLGGVLALGTVGGWTYTNSTPFCGTVCHTMPPQYSTFLRSPHSRVACVECHIGRDSLPVILSRKVVHSEVVLAQLTNTYEFPIFAKKMSPAD